MKRTMKSITLFFAAFLLVTWASRGAIAAISGAVTLPQDGDNYSKLVAQAESGDMNVDFGAMRNAWLGSAAYKRAIGSEGLLKIHMDLLAFRKSFNEAYKAKNYAEAANVARQMLSIDYIDLYGHSYLYSACAALDDKACAEGNKAILLKLLGAIAATGNGRSCTTAFKVFSVDEEYFIISSMSLKHQKQSIVNEQSNVCDKMDEIDPKGNSLSLFFNINDVLPRELKG